MILLWDELKMDYHKLYFVSPFLGVLICLQCLGMLMWCEEDADSMGCALYTAAVGF